MDEAETHYRLAQEMLLRLYGPEHPEVAQTYGNLANFLLSGHPFLLRAILNIVRRRRGTICTFSAVICYR